MNSFSDGLMVQAIDGRRIGTLSAVGDDCIWVETLNSETVCVSQAAILGVDHSTISLVCPTEGLERYYCPGGATGGRGSSAG